MKGKLNKRMIDFRWSCLKKVGGRIQRIIAWKLNGWRRKVAILPTRIEVGTAGEKCPRFSAWTSSRGGIPANK